MARLNDLPGPTESIEALKRRFVRQNREIARVNSLQSLRIQGLESDVTQLLKENAALKEQVISLSHDAQKYEAGRFLCKDIYQYKEKLASRLSELNSLVSEFGKLPEKFLSSVDAANTGNSMDSHLAPDIGPRSVTRPEDDGRLPTIVEDKYFPRRTLDIEDMENMTEDMQDIDSPNIGPPPVAHFDVDESPFSEPTSDDSEITKYKPSQDTENLSSQPLGALDVHQERTIKPATPVEITMPPVISGSKRKFSATDDEESFSARKITMDDDFEFARSVTDPQKQISSTTFKASNNMHNTAGSDKVQKKKPNPPNRKVLEPKSTNMIASSPRRQQGAENTKQKADYKEISPIKHRNETVIVNRVEILDGKRHSRSARPKKGKQSNDWEEKPNTAVLDGLEPLESYDEQPKSSDPGNIHEGAATDASYPARQSRRQRGAVSYAEPNLRHKMRRSTNELTDAVVASQRRASSAQTDKFSQEDVAFQDPTKTKRKSAPMNNEDSVSSSTYGGTATTIAELESGQKLADIPRNMITERKRRTLSANPGEITRSQEHDPKSELKHKRGSDQATSNRSDRIAETNTSAYPQRRSTHRHSSIAEAYSNLSRDDSLGDDETNDNSDSKTSLESPDSGEGKRTARKSAHALAAAETTQAKRSQRAGARRRSMLL
ncbi:Shugoshin [Talaromyces islandicus]|uniref:Shugoshin n=1 Tax=Talaromyces islandicus TaxID=28573 RepID=A0A0U1LQG0_TALIS|nr:Shugoshin [Talaromyces islandicus]